MDNEHDINVEHLQNPEVSYDRSDLSARGIVAFLIGLAVAGIIIHIVLWGMYKYLAQQDLQSQPAAPPIATTQRQLPQGGPAQTFPEPRLQPAPTADMTRFRLHEEEVLNTYGWVDQKAGVVRVPISRAMEILVQRGLPVRPQHLAPATQAGGSRVEADK